MRFLVTALLTALFVQQLMVSAVWGQKTLSPASAPATKVEYKWLLIQHKNSALNSTIIVNGKLFATYDRQGGGFESKPVPFKESENEIIIKFAPRDAKTSPFSNNVSLLLSPAMMPGDQAMPLDECEVQEGYAERKLKFKYSHGQPGNINVQESCWLDEARKTRTLETAEEYDPAARKSRKLTQKSWDAKGHPRYELEQAEGKITQSKDYKPDGTVGAEVKKGNGFHRVWNDEGVLTDETPILDGMIHGQKKGFDDSGTLRETTNYVKDKREGEYVSYDENKHPVIRGQYKNDQKEGQWVRLDAQGKEKTQSEFKEGKLTNGKDRFIDAGD